jgi:hypothetical protein
MGSPPRVPSALATAPDGLTPCAGHGERPTRARARDHRNRRARGAVPGGGGGDAREYSGFPEVPHEYPVSTREDPLDRSARGAIRSESGGPRPVGVARTTLECRLSILPMPLRWPRGGYAVATRQAMDPDAKRDAWLRIWKHFFNHRRGPMGYSGVLVESPGVSH